MLSRRQFAVTGASLAVAAPAKAAPALTVRQVLDRMRGSGHALSPQDHESLVDLIEQKFPE